MLFSYFGNTEYSVLCKKFYFDGICCTFFDTQILDTEEANVSTYSHSPAVRVSVHLSVLFWDKCIGKVNICLKHLIFEY